MQSHQEMKITGHTGLYGIVAHPIRHSLSPMMHNQAFETLGIDDVYLAFDVKENDLDAFMKSVRPMDIKGMNVSMPYKEKMLSYMDELTDRAKLCHAVNTVKNVNGKLIGHITDGIGFVEACKQKGWMIEGQKVVMLGAGGAAKAIMVELSLCGVKDIIVYNRSYRSYVEQLNEQLSCSLTLKPLEDLKSLKEDLHQADLLIQTTNVGMHPHEDGCLIPDIDYLSSQLKVIDIIYYPQETKLLRMARSKGLETMNGEGMILYQAAASFEYWTGQKMPLKEVKKRLEMRSKS